MFDFCGNTSSTRAGAWSRHVFSLIFHTTQQFHAFSISPGTSPIDASGATNIKNIIIVPQCESTLHLAVYLCCNLGIDNFILCALGQKYFFLSAFRSYADLLAYCAPPPLIVKIFNCWTPYSPLTCPREKLEVWWFSFFEMAAPRLNSVAQNVT